MNCELDGTQMNNKQKQQIGSIIQAIGTVLSAFANTPNKFLKDKFLDDLDLIGNTLQATGNALVADGQNPLTLSRIGNEVQAVGNTTVIAGMIMSFEDTTKQILNIKGNLLLVFGACISLGDELDEEPSYG
jgi:ABC-type transporter Mla maintaining outer membrane lipid asymmetry permease subunit MlaE